MYKSSSDGLGANCIQYLGGKVSMESLLLVCERKKPVSGEGVYQWAYLCKVKLHNAIEEWYCQLYEKRFTKSKV